MGPRAERLDGRETLKGEAQGSGLKRGYPEMAIGRKCSLGEILQVWDSVDGRVSEDFQGEVSRTLWGPRFGAKR